MNKIRLIITKDCPNSCPKCCNKKLDFNSIPIIKNYNCDELIITGGEPLGRNILKTVSLLNYLKYVDTDSKRKIFVYTTDLFQFSEIIHLVDGITLTIHNNVDMKNFICWNEYEKLTMYHFNEIIKDKSLRLYIFKDVIIPENLDLSDWDVRKNLEWNEDCPIPEDETLLRTKNI